jgi:ssDNA-binding replication factor A large subunit
MDNYQKLVEKISSISGLSIEEIDRRVEGKRAKLSGLVSKEGAAQIVAAEQGINFDKERLKISELAQGMKRANVLGKVIEVLPVREYDKNGRQGKIGKLKIADESSTALVVFWDTNHISLIEEGKIINGSVIEISNGNVRNNEIHLGSFSDVKISSEKMDNVVEKRVMAIRKLNDVKPGDSFKTRAVVVQSFEPRYFEVCSECRKKVVDGQCMVHGAIKAEKRALLNVVLDDGNETMKAILFGENIKKLGLSDEEIFSLEKFNEKKTSFLGEEKVFTGNLRANQLYNSIEFYVDSIEEFNADELIKELQAGK